MGGRLQEHGRGIIYIEGLDKVDVAWSVTTKTKISQRHSSRRAGAIFDSLNMAERFTKLTKSTESIESPDSLPATSVPSLTVLE